jgi:hypothetical protein
MGTVIVSTVDGPAIQVSGNDDASQVERVQISDLALVYRGASQKKTAEGIKLWNARQASIENVYISGFPTGIEQGKNSWQGHFDRVRIYNFTFAGIWAHDQGEDSLYTNVILRGYNTQAMGVYMSAMAQNNTFVDCDMSDNGYGIVMQQGDDSGNGSGRPYPMSATVIGSSFEAEASAAFLLKSSNRSAAVDQYPTITVIGGRIYATAATPAMGVADLQQANHAVFQNLIVNGTVSQAIQVGRVNMAQWTGTTSGIKTVAGGDTSRFSMSSDKVIPPMTSNANAAINQRATAASAPAAALRGNTTAFSAQELAQGSCIVAVAHIAGAHEGMIPVASPATDLGDGVLWNAYIDGESQIKVRLCNVSHRSATVPASTFRVQILP